MLRLSYAIGASDASAFQMRFTESMSTLRETSSGRLGVFSRLARSCDFQPPKLARLDGGNGGLNLGGCGADAAEHE